MLLAKRECVHIHPLLPGLICLLGGIAVTTAGEEEAETASPHVGQDALGLLDICIDLHPIQLGVCYADTPMSGLCLPLLMRQPAFFMHVQGVSHLVQICVDHFQALSLPLQLHQRVVCNLLGSQRCL